MMDMAPQSVPGHPVPSTRSVVRIDPPSGWAPVDLPELWRHRSLLAYLALRDIRVMLSRTHLGVLWVVAPPLITAALMVVVLGILAKVPAGDLPYALIVLSGIAPWMYFSNTVSKATASMTANAYLLTKVYFPRLIVPAVPMLSELITFAALLVVLGLGLLYYGVPARPSWFAVVLPIALCLQLTVGASLWLSALNVRIPDIANFVPILLQVLAYASPIYYPHSLIPAKWHWLYDLNPFVGIVESMRWSLFAQDSFPSYSVATSMMFGVVLVGTGVIYFRRVEDTAADLV